MRFMNLTLNDAKWASLFPSGLYKFEIRVNMAGSEFYYLMVTFELKSNLQTPFWKFIYDFEHINYKIENN